MQAFLHDYEARFRDVVRVSDTFLNKIAHKRIIFLTDSNMPRAIRRQARAKRLIQHYVFAKKAGEKRLQHRKAKLRQTFQHANRAMGRVNSPASLSSLSDMSISSEASDSSSSSGGLEDRLNWRHHNHGLHDTELPELASFTGDGFSDSESDNENFRRGGSDDFDSDLLDDADDELSDYYGLGTGSSEDDNSGLGEPINSDKWARLRKWVLEQLSEMYARRYFSNPNLT
jgi:hypothetical protein